MFEMMNCLPPQEERLAKAIYTYVNYDDIQKRAHEEGSIMDEDRDFYAYTILSIFENNFKGMSEDDIRISIGDCLALGMDNGHRRFHTSEQIAAAINEKFGQDMVTEEQVIKSSLIETTGAQSHMGIYLPKDYALRVGEFFLTVHDYGVTENITVSIA